MTAPTITVAERFISDCTAATEVWEGTSDTWTETEDGQTAAISVAHGDIFDINVTVSAGNKIAYYSYPNEGGANNLGILSATYTKCFWKYKTSDTNIKAKITLVFNDATTQDVLDETSNVNWTYGSATITTGKTIDHIRLHANQATGHVYYDFVGICWTIFTFPQVRPGGVEFWLEPREASLSSPGRGGDIEQDLGFHSPRFKLSGHMESGQTWGSTTTGTTILEFGEYLYYIARGVYGDYKHEWHYLTTDLGSGKVKLTKPGLHMKMDPESGVQRVWSIDFKMRSLSSFTEADWDGLWWVGQ